MDQSFFLIAALVLGLAALVLAVWFTRQVLAAPMGNDRMKEIAGAIREGSMAFLLARVSVAGGVRVGDVCSDRAGA